MVIPLELADRLNLRPDSVVILPVPLPFIAEIWSPSTGRTDLREKLPSYRQRGDREVWFFRLGDRLVRAWRRQDDGTYMETVLRGGTVPLTGLPGVLIDLDGPFLLTDTG